MKTDSLLCAMLIISAALSINATTFAAPDSAQKEGRIAFVSDRDGHAEIYVMNADGSGQSALTHDDWEESSNPSWSFDGHQIAFNSSRDGNQEIYILDADGSGQRRLTRNVALDVSPTWSPDGQQIVYCSSISERDTNGIPHIQLYKVDANGGTPTRLTHNAASDTQPTFSPDGRKIAFVSNRDSNEREERLEIYVMSADGSEPKRLTQNATDDTAPVFSPDGKSIAFVSERDGISAIYLMHSDGTEVRRVSSKGVFARHPSWSPDGNWIVFESENQKRELGIYVMDANGGHRTQLPLAQNHNFSPVWGLGQSLSGKLPAIPLAPASTTEPALEPAPVAIAKAAHVSLVNSTAFAALRGRLIYTFTEPTSPNSYYITLLEIGSDAASTETGQPTNVTYEIKNLSGGIEAKPQFSPDGQFVLVESFTYTSSGKKRYWNYVWDTHSTQLKTVMPSSFNGDFLGWSPDSSWMLFMTFDSSTPIPRLEVVNWRTQKRSVLPPGATQLSWLSPHLVLYSALPSKLTKENKAEVTPATHPNIYSFSPESGRATLLVQDGQLPTASPDGQRIAFLGSEHPEKPFPLNEDWEYQARGVALSIAKSDGSERKALNVVSGNYPTVIWEADNRHLLTVRPNADDVVPFTKIEEWDSVTGMRRQIAKVGGEEVSSLGISRDGRTLFLEENASETPDTLQVLELSTGAATTLARLEDIIGFDWQETVSDTLNN